MMAQDPIGKPSSRSPEKLWTPANIVTLVRICLVPIFVVAILTPWPAYFGLNQAWEFKSWVAACIFIILAATDGLDGYLARSRGEISDFGKFIDPLADKILVAAALLSLIELGVLPSWPALIILAREFIVSGIRMLAASKGYVIAASWYGKAKTVTQIIAIVLFIVKDTVVVVDPQGALHSPLYLISWAVMLVAVLLTILSMLDYFSKARHLFGFAPSNSSASTVKAQDGDFVGDLSLDNSLDKEVLYKKAESLVQRASERGLSLGSAESLTGGLIASQITAVPGSSAVFKGGIVSYTNEVKHEILAVSQSHLDTLGAVSEEVAKDMATGAQTRLGCDIAVSVTGIAGPGGAEPGKPVGSVWLGLKVADEAPRAFELHFEGDREAVRMQTLATALDVLLKAVGD